VKTPSLFLALLLAIPLVLQARQDASPDAPAATQSNAPAQASSAHVVLQAAELKWGEAPPAFERGAQAVVLSGDPGKAGLFVIRLKMPAGYKVANHWHPTDEHVTLLDGDLTIRMNDGAETRTLSRDAYLLLPTRMHHAVSTTSGATVQVSAMGPFELTYVDPKDDPRKRTP
jgi:quercetin dioxygenase-like cupin family protein